MSQNFIIEEIGKNICNDFNDWYEIKIAKLAQFFTKKIEVKDTQSFEENLVSSKSIINVDTKPIQLTFAGVEEMIR